MSWTSRSEIKDKLNPPCPARAVLPTRLNNHSINFICTARNRLHRRGYRSLQLILQRGYPIL